MKGVHIKVQISDDNSNLCKTYVEHVYLPDHILEAQVPHQTMFKKLVADAAMKAFAEFQKYEV